MYKFGLIVIVVVLVVVHGVVVLVLMRVHMLNVALQFVIVLVVGHVVVELVLLRVCVLLNVVKLSCSRRPPSCVEYRLGCGSWFGW